MDLMN